MQRIVTFKTVGCGEAHDERSREQIQSLIYPEQNTKEITGDSVNTTTLTLMIHDQKKKKKKRRKHRT